MWKVKSFLIGVAGVLVFGGLAQAVEFVPAVNYVSGEIAWVDVQLGKLQLRDAPGDRGITEYRINQQATNVTDPSDKKFLNLDDLRSGQRIAIEFESANSQGERMARKITMEPMPESPFQQAFGELESIDVNAGTLVLEERPVARRAGGRGSLSYFLFEPRNVVVMRSPSSEPIRLELNPGDPLKVEYVVENGKQWARFVTLYSVSPEPTDTTVITTTTTSVTTTQ